MQISLGCFVLGFGLLTAVPALGQSHLPRFAGGVYGSIGIGSSFNESAGGYVEAARFRIRPGVEVRGSAQSFAVTGLVLAGPRVARPLFGLNVYAVGLLGPSRAISATGTREVSGLTSQMAAGIEKDIGPHVRWREEVELNSGYFNGARGWQTFVISAGLVLHFH